MNHNRLSKLGQKHVKQKILVWSTTWRNSWMFSWKNDFAALHLRTRFHMSLGETTIMAEHEFTHSSFLFYGWQDQSSHGHSLLRFHDTINCFNHELQWSHDVTQAGPWMSARFQYHYLFFFMTNTASWLMMSIVARMAQKWMFGGHQKPSWISTWEIDSIHLTSVFEMLMI